MIAVRAILTVVLVWFIYGETGWATALFAFLVWLGLEAQTQLWVMHQRAHSRMAEFMATKRWKDG